MQGGTLKKEFGSIEYDEWVKVFDINLTIPFLTTQYLNPYINTDGRIIFISSVMSRYAHSSSVAYGVSKASINSLVEHLIKYFGDKAITVNAIGTGFTETGMIKRTQEHEESIKGKIALHRFAKPEEIARFCWQIIDNGYINGALLDINGGYCFK